MGNEVTTPRSKENAFSEQKTDSSPKYRYIPSDRTKINRSSTMKANKELNPILTGIKAKINRYANRTGSFIRIVCTALRFSVLTNLKVLIFVVSQSQLCAMASSSFSNPVQRTTTSLPVRPQKSHIWSTVAWSSWRFVTNYQTLCAGWKNVRIIGLAVLLLDRKVGGVPIIRVYDIGVGKKLQTGMPYRFAWVVLRWVFKNATKQHVVAFRH